MAKKIVLSTGLTTIVDDEDFALLGHYRWFGVGPRRNYPTRWDPERRRHVYMHREILGEPEGLVVDHIDRDPLNNRRDNLRAVTKSEDLRNRGEVKRGRALKPYDGTQARYLATDLVAQVIDEQGRIRTWMGEQISISRSHVSHVLAGRRTLAENDARKWAEILGVPFSLLWKLADRSEEHADRSVA